MMMSRTKSRRRGDLPGLVKAGTFFAAAFILFGCASAPAPPKAVTETAAPVAFTPPVEPRTKGSLWSPNRQLRLYEDLRARQVGDIVTVNVVENSDAKNEAETSSDRDTSLDAKVTGLLGYQVPTDNQNFVGATLGNKFKGKGSTDRKSEMSTSIACRVVAVMPSGNLHIKGSRLTTVNAEKLFITLEGVIRPSDISPENVVLSTHVAEARITYTGSGPVSDQQRPGWFTRLMNAIWPF
jgi:flagellar L-ring protein precursor FlgH